MVGKLEKKTANLLDRFGRAIEEGDSIFDYEPNSWLVDDAAIESFFQPKCRPINYENVMKKHGSVIQAFLEEIGLNLSECPAWEDYFFNRS